MRTVTLEPLTTERFVGYGEVLAVPEEPGRVYFESALGNGRARAWPSLSMARKAPNGVLPMEARVMERHEFSSQSFVALGPARWLVIVAPHRTDGAGPDVERMIGFIAGADQGVTLAPNVWHHPLTVLDAPAAFVVFMWRDGTTGDEEFVDIPPVVVTAGAAQSRGASR